MLNKRECSILTFGFGLLILGIIFDKEIEIFMFIYSYQNVFLINLMKVISNLGSVVAVFLIASFILGFLSSEKTKKKNILLFWIAIVLTSLITYFLKIIVSRERPISFYQEPYNKFSSFPSGHATAVFTALPFMKKFKFLGKFWLVFSLLVAFSRIYLGFHYLSDVVAGGLIGYTIGLLIEKNKELNNFLERVLIKK
ncbi:MAG: phosphatase PAP2 family protein [Candidatus Pacearchaeota archaeon]